MANIRPEPEAKPRADIEGQGSYISHIDRETMLHNNISFSLLLYTSLYSYIILESQIFFCYSEVPL